MRKTLDTLYRRGAAILSATALAVLPDAAFAQGTGLGRVATNVTENLTTLPALISYASYVGGAGFGVAGVLKLRQHVDAPTQVALKDCLVRFAVCAMLIALPSIIMMAINTIGGSTQANLRPPSLSN